MKTVVCSSTWVACLYRMSYSLFHLNPQLSCSQIFKQAIWCGPLEVAARFIQVWRPVVLPPSLWCCFHLQPGAGAPSESPVFWPRRWMGSLLAELVCRALWFLHSYTQRQGSASGQGVYLLKGEVGGVELRGATTFWPRIILCMHSCGPVHTRASAVSKCPPCLMNEHLSVFCRGQQRWDRL